jgi:hypothetical protein
MGTIEIDEGRLKRVLATAEMLASEWLDMSSGRAAKTWGETFWLDNVDGDAWEISVNNWPVGDTVKTVIAVSLGHGNPVGYLAAREKTVQRQT